MTAPVHLTALEQTRADAALGAAWRRCEAALPEGWELHVWASPTGSRWRNAQALPPMGTRIRKITAAWVDADPAQLLECPQGHAYTDENTRVFRRKRYCRMCDRLRARANRRLAARSSR